MTKAEGQTTWPLQLKNESATSYENLKKKKKRWGEMTVYYQYLTQNMMVPQVRLKYDTLLSFLGGNSKDDHL